MKEGKKRLQVVFVSTNIPSDTKIKERKDYQNQNYC